MEQSTINRPSRTFKDHRAVVGNDIKIVVRPTQVEIAFGKTIDPTSIFVIQIWRAGQLLNEHSVDASQNYTSAVPRSIDIRECGIRVCLPSGIVISELDVEEDQYPFMRPRREQVHVTENYVSVPPALTITDEVGSVWTLGMTAADPRQSPEGEFAFAVVRNGIKTGEIASRIERRNGKIKIFTADGWKSWNGRSFF